MPLTAIRYQRGQFEGRLSDGTRCVIHPSVDDPDVQQALHREGGWYVLPSRPVDTAGIPYTSKDKLWEFTTKHWAPGTEIRTKRQWERFKKSHHLMDDMTPKEKATYYNTGQDFKARTQKQAEQRQQMRALIRAVDREHRRIDLRR